MSSISSGVGLSSGIDIASLIDQMLSLEGRRKLPIQSRLARVATTRASLLQSRSLLLSLRNASLQLSKPSTIAAQVVTSSNASIVGASLGDGSAANGAVSFLVRSLASAARILSRGLGSSEAALGAHSITIHHGGGRLVDDRPLSELRGGAGIPPGRIRITDRSGAQAVVDLRDARSIDEVLDAIDSSPLSVHARLSADGRAIELVDTGSGLGSIVVQEWGGGSTASALGLLGSSQGAATLAGSVIAALGDSTPLASIGTGIPIVDGAAAFDMIVNGTTVSIGLGAGHGGTPPRAATLGDLLSRIDEALAQSGVGDIASVSIAPSGDRLAVTLSGSGTIAFAPSGDDGDSGAASAAALERLGLDGLVVTGSGDAPAATAQGRRILMGMHDVPLSLLAGGAGLELQGSLTVIDRLGRSFTLARFDGVDSVQSLLARLRSAAADAGMELDIDLDSSGTRLELRDRAAGAGTLSASGEIADRLGLASGGSPDLMASADLRRADIGWGTALGLLGGPSLDGSIQVTDRAGASATIGVTAGMTLLDLSRALAASGVAVRVQPNDRGDGLLLVDESGGTGSLVIADGSGGAASALRIAGASSEGRLDGTRTTHLLLDGTESADDLAALLDSIPGLDAALVVDDDGELRLTIDGTGTGSRHDLSLAIAGADLGLAVAVRARDAKILLSPESAGGILVTSDTNRFDGAIPGVVLDLLATSDDVITVTTAPSTTPLVSAVSSFVSALKKAIEQLRQATSVDPEDSTRGPLYGNLAAARARNALRSLLGAAFGPDGARLSRLGITVGSSGAVNFDEGVLVEALEEDPEGVRELLAANDGVAARFDAVLGAFVEPSTGAFDLDDTRLSRVTDAANATLDRIDLGLERRRAVLLARFTAMEAAIERLRAQQSALQSLVSSISG